MRSLTTTTTITTTHNNNNNISIRGYVRPSIGSLVCPSVRWSVGQSVGQLVTQEFKSRKVDFLDAFLHFYKRACLSFHLSVGWSVGWSVNPSVGLTVGPSRMSCISEKWAKFKQNSIRNKKVSVWENASVFRTLFDLLSLF